MGLFFGTLKPAQAAINPMFFHHMRTIINTTAKYSAGKSALTGSGIVGSAMFFVISAPAIWHIPAWEAAKDAGTEKQYQAQEMWPQQLFDKLPGGTPGRLNPVR